MEFENKKTAIRIYLRKMIIALVVVILLAAILVSGWFERDLLGIQKYTWVILVTLAYLATVVLSRYRKLNFFFFSDESAEIVVRYYPVQPLVQKKRAVRIPKTGFAGYEIKTSLFGLRKDLMLRQKVKGRTANYPPIAVSSLKKKDVELISTQLDKYTGP